MPLNARGVGAFQNDNLVPFLLRIVEGGVVQAASLLRAFEVSAADCASCQAAVAAAEIVAAAVGRPGPDLPPIWEEKVAAGGWTPPPLVVSIAIKTVLKIRAGSALRIAFEDMEHVEPGLVDEWCEAIENLVDRLQAGTTAPGSAVRR
jgi:hypothetical protein